MVGRQVLSFLSLMQEEKSISAFCATAFTCFTFLPRKMSERNLCFPLNKLTGAGIMKCSFLLDRKEEMIIELSGKVFFSFVLILFSKNSS